LSSSHHTVSNHGIILHDVAHRQERDANYKVCNFNVPYECSGGTTLHRGEPIWSSQAPAVGTNDNMMAYAWVDLPDKHGLVYFGQLATTPTGYRAPHDADGLIHVGYAMLPGSPAHCCHGQDDPSFQATGPWAHCRVPMGWIYNPDDLVTTARGAASLWSRRPTSAFQWRDYVPSMPLRVNRSFTPGAVFDAPTRRIYVVFTPDYHPAMMVFEVR
jgi:hypothetical protein